MIHAKLTLNVISASYMPLSESMQMHNAMRATTMNINAMQMAAKIIL